MARDRNSDYAILGLLSLRPMSGYDVRKMVRLSIGHFWNESYGQIYPTLKRLHDEGLVTRAAQERSDRADRQLYRLTPAGRARLREWLISSPRPQSVRDELLLKLFFGRLAPEGREIEHIQDFRRKLTGTRDAYLQLRRQLQAEHRNNQDLPFWLITLNHGIHRTRALIEWCDETLITLAHLRRQSGRRSRKN
jgi:DNA-binding PadR family transcriptional regulator